MKRKVTTVLLSILAGLACSAQTAATQPAGGFYFLSMGTNMPPLPVNLRPGYPETPAGNAVIVNDTLSDAQALSYAQELLARGINPLTASGGAPNPPGSTNGSQPIVQSTNGWMGTFIFGFCCPGTNDLLNTNHTLNRHPIFWNIWCSQTSNSFTHVAPEWESLTRVHAGDVVSVFWHLQCSNHVAPWAAFAIIDRGTNTSGCYTNALVATMPTQGNTAQWMIPSSATISNLNWLKQNGYQPLAPNQCLSLFSSGIGDWLVSTNITSPSAPTWTNTGPYDPQLPPFMFDTNQPFFCIKLPQFGPTNGPLTLTNYPTTNWPAPVETTPIWLPTYPETPIISPTGVPNFGPTTVEYITGLWHRLPGSTEAGDFPGAGTPLPAPPTPPYTIPPFPTGCLPPGVNFPITDHLTILRARGFPGTFDVQIKHGARGWSTSPSDRLLFTIPATNWVYVPPNTYWGRSDGLGLARTNINFVSNITLSAEGTNTVWLMSTNPLGAHFIRTKRVGP